MVNASGEFTGIIFDGNEPSLAGRYLYDGSQVIAEYDAGNNLQRSYTHGYGLLALADGTSSAVAQTWLTALTPVSGTGVSPAATLSNSVVAPPNSGVQPETPSAASVRTRAAGIAATLCGFVRACEIILFAPEC